MLKIIYAGTPEFALPALQALIAGEHEVVAVYTQPDRPAGRGRKLQPGPVKSVALEHRLPVYQPLNFADPADVDLLRGFDADLMVVAAYGLLLPSVILGAPRLGCINLHASLLPRWRGASPIQQAILAGDERTGISLMQMEPGLDSGPILASRALDIDGQWSAGDLHDRLAPLAAELLEASLGDIENLLARARPQNEAEVTYAPRLQKQQARVDWTKPATQLAREIRAYNPWPVSHTNLGADSLRLWRAVAEAGEAGDWPGRVLAHDREGIRIACGSGCLRVTELQFAGRKRCSAAEALNARNLVGSQLGDGA